MVDQSEPLFSGGYSSKKRKFGHRHMGRLSHDDRAEIRVTQM
jgi:hypothetical protein